MQLTENDRIYIPTNPFNDDFIPFGSLSYLETNNIFHTPLSGHLSADEEENLVKNPPNSPEADLENLTSLTPFSPPMQSRTFSGPGNLTPQLLEEGPDFVLSPTSETVGQETNKSGKFSKLTHHSLLEKNPSQIQLIEKKRKGPTSLSFSDWDEMGLTAQQIHPQNSLLNSSENIIDLSSKSISNNKTLDRSHFSSNSSSDSYSFPHTPPNTPNSENSFDSAHSDFSLQEWDYNIDTMDLNSLLSPPKSPNKNSNVDLSPTKTIRRRRKREWKASGFLALHLHRYEREAIRANVQSTFDLNLPPIDDHSAASSSGTKRVKFQKSTKGKNMLKYGLSEGDSPDQEQAEGATAEGKKKTTRKGRKEIKKKNGAADRQSSTKG